ncbi:DUF3244 domain-containing protein [Pararhodonellum marinum]|uniref:DUF3244 domain-containing protein n=1 Tax=Pararhodonellum marinum TaxID=2755358 RepID=UPI00188F5370|nr:DUF3244 domain-containing protein [Pararhodonellum marinum]
MKTLFTFLFAVGFAFMTLANPSNTSLMEASKVEAKDQKVKVRFQEGAGKLMIKIMSSNGKLLHSQRLHVKDALVVPFDLSELPEGEYQVQIENEEEIATYYVASKAPQPAQLPLMAYGKTIDDQTINLLVVGLEEPGVTVNIRTQNGKLVHKDQVEQAEGFSKNYVLKNMKADEVYLELVDTNGRRKNIYF